MSHIDTCLFFRNMDVDFIQFLDGSWNEVPFPFLAISEVSYTIQNET
jgi:hypothetical protein